MKKEKNNKHSIGNVNLDDPMLKDLSYFWETDLKIIETLHANLDKRWLKVKEILTYYKTNRAGGLWVHYYNKLIDLFYEIADIEPSEYERMHKVVKLIKKVKKAK